MSNDYKPLNPSAKIIEGRLPQICWIINRIYSNILPNFSSLITEEDRENPRLKAKFANNIEAHCLINNMYKANWSLMRKPGTFAQNDLIVMMGMSTREERDNIPRRLFIFRPADVENVVINTSIGERESTFFSMDKKDEWCQFSCESHEVGLALRSLETGTIDPDLAGSPFKSYLTSILTGTPAPTVVAAPPQTANDWDDDLPF